MTPTLVPRNPKGSAGAHCRAEASGDGEASQSRWVFFPVSFPAFQIR